jgi:hypothetical protein
MKTIDGNTKTKMKKHGLPGNEISNRSQGIQEQFRQEIIQPGVFCHLLTRLGD